MNDNRFRLAAVAGVESEREYLLDYAGTAMRLTGLSMLQIQDAEDRILSSGHFRNEHGRVAPGLAAALRGASGVALVTVRGAEREFLALARVESFLLGGRVIHPGRRCRGGRSVPDAAGPRSIDRRVAALLRGGAADRPPHAWSDGRLGGRRTAAPGHPGRIGPTARGRAGHGSR